MYISPYLLGNMEFKGIIQQLENNNSVFENLLKNKTENQYLWRPKPEKWCLLEIIGHLLDEEIYDFRASVKHALEHPTQPLVPINPEGWVTEHQYISRDYNQTLQLFLEERTISIKWLKMQTDVNWNSSLTHPDLGELSAGFFLRNWLAHDYLHIRQILNYQYGFFKSTSDIDLSYAGSW
ncbi:DinB family protein [Algibacter sp. 2305UL17-15]|uniref:DinB family protein n=1 Tax=Algibacter sp. 2305UL17-15 TaxID=3231268 RepID=UPI003459288B